MKQIAYLTMVFLPATFAAVRLNFYSFFLIIEKYLPGFFWYERERDNAFHQWNPLGILCSGYPTHTCYCLGHRRGPEQVYIP